jgi:uncharacterized protein
MTTTIPPQHVPKSSPSRRPRPPHRGPGGTRRPSPSRRSLVAIAVLLAVTALAAGLRGDPAVIAHGPEMDADVRGTYELGDGALLTIFGSGRMPRYELAGRVTQLMVDGRDVLVSMSGEETLSVARDDTGLITGVRLERPDEPPAFAVAAAAHTEREVRISSDGPVLAGTLLLPAGPGPHPAVVFAHGAGPHDRFGTFRLLGSHMARRGVAALMYDKRGVGDSTGSYTDATFDDLTADTLAGVDLLARHPGVAADRIGVVGFSQGGWTVADAARQRDDIAFVIAMSASGFTPADQQAWLHGSMLAARGFDRSALRMADRVSRMLYSSLDLVEAGVMPAIPHIPGFWFHALDPYQETAELWADVRQPVLLMWGAQDCQVPAHDSVEVLAGALRRGGNTDVTLTVLPDADHGLTVRGPCEMETGGHHDAHVYADGALTLGPEWVNALPDGLGDLPSSAPPATTVLDWHLEPPRPAPWYGTLAVQLAAFALLLLVFGGIAARWALAGVRSRRGDRHVTVGRQGHLRGIAGLAGLAATIVVFAAFTEIAVLGAVHAAPLAGSPVVDGSSVLMTVARVLVVLALTLTVATVPALRRHRAGRSPASSWGLPAGGVLLLLWAGYWQLLPLP